MNINGYCPHCKANLDGDLVIDYPLSQGKTHAEALDYARCYAGWNEQGEENRWSRAISIYSWEKDRTTSTRCPDCSQEWQR
jgi:hypothetical protein